MDRSVSKHLSHTWPAQPHLPVDVLFNEADAFPDVKPLQECCREELRSEPETSHHAHSGQGGHSAPGLPDTLPGTTPLEEGRGPPRGALQKRPPCSPEEWLLLVSRAATNHLGDHSKGPTTSSKGKRNRPVVSQRATK